MNCPDARFSFTALDLAEALEAQLQDGHEHENANSCPSCRILYDAILGNEKVIKYLSEINPLGAIIGLVPYETAIAMFLLGTSLGASAQRIAQERRELEKTFQVTEPPSQRIKA